MSCGKLSLNIIYNQAIFNFLLYSMNFILGWISCFLLVMALIFSKSLITLATNAIYTTIIHMTWSIIILWIIIASISKHRGNIYFLFEHFKSIKSTKYV